MRLRSGSASFLIVLLYGLLHPGISSAQETGDSLSANSSASAPIIVRGNTLTKAGNAFKFNAIRYDTKAGRISPDLARIIALGANSVEVSRFDPALFRVADSLGLMVLLTFDVPEKLSSEGSLAWRSRVLRETGRASKHTSLVAAGYDLGNLVPNEEQAQILRNLASQVEGLRRDLLLYSISPFPTAILPLELGGLTTNHYQDWPSAAKAIERAAGLHTTRPLILFGFGGFVHEGFDRAEETHAIRAQHELSKAEQAGFAGASYRSLYDRSTARRTLLGQGENILRNGIYEGSKSRKIESVLKSHFLGEPLPPIQEPRSSADTPFGFLAYGFLLIALLFLLLNVDRRFRDHIGRALTRPYNFFADIRDQRIIPNAQTGMLTVVIGGSLMLLFGGLLYAFKSSFAADYFLRHMLPWRWIHEPIMSAAWDPFSLIVFGTLVFIALLMLLTLVVRFAAIFVKGRIFFSDAMNVVVWSMLPVVFLLPYAMLITRLDRNETLVQTALWLLAIIAVWVLYRALKGVAVLFDIYPTRVYLYGFLGIVLVLLAAILHMNYHHDMLESLSNFRRMVDAGNV